MMKMNKIAARWVFIILAILAPLVAAGYIHHQRDNFSCETHVTLVDKNAVVDLIMNYAFEDGVGYYQTSGDYLVANQPPVAVSNNVTFNYWREDGRMIMVSSETNALPKNNLPFRLNMPDFFQYRERGLRMQVVPANASSYYFIYSHSPVFYCTKG